VFRDTGFLNTSAIRVGGQSVVPRDLTSALVFEHWKLREGEEDLTVMQVVVEGEAGGDAVRRTYDLLDSYDSETGTTSMARTTGYTCTVVARQVLGLSGTPNAGDDVVAGDNGRIPSSDTLGRACPRRQRGVGYGAYVHHVRRHCRATV